jgi:hypothetical protein
VEPARPARSQSVPGGAHRGHLELDTFRRIDLRSPVTRFSIPGQISAKGRSKSTSDLVFEGSPLEQFMASTFTAGSGQR